MSLQETQNFWDTYADEYEKVATENTSQLFYQLLNFIPLALCSSILETGCGTGSGLEILRRALPNSCKLTGSDYSSVMVEKSLSKSLPNCEIFQEDSQNLSFPSSTFDGYLANLSLHLVPDPLKMLKEAFRVIKPGATAVFSVWGKEEDTNIFKIIKNAQMEVMGNQIQGNEEKPRSPFHLNDQQNLNHLANQAGFVSVRSFFTSIPLNVVNGDEFLLFFRNEPKMLEVKARDEEVYRRILEKGKSDAERILDSGRHITFDALVIAGEKSRVEEDRII
jgi:ubiquinone/menaquinone biosynthesis C-methylase UbiE